MLVLAVRVSAQFPNDNRSDLHCCEPPGGKDGNCKRVRGIVVATARRLWDCQSVFA